MNAQAAIQSSQHRIIEGLSKCEATIATLYERYANTFPEMRNFWMALSGEEKIHAVLLRTMHRLLDRGEVFYNIGAFNQEAVQPVITIAERAMDELQEHSVDSARALAVAVEIETSLVDSHFYDTVEGSSPEFAIIAKRLTGDTRRHISHVQNAVCEYAQ